MDRRRADQRAASAPGHCCPRSQSNPDTRPQSGRWPYPHTAPSRGTRCSLGHLPYRPGQAALGSYYIIGNRCERRPQPLGSSIKLENFPTWEIFSVGGGIWLPWRRKGRVRLQAKLYGPVVPVFWRAFQKGEIKRLVVVTSLTDASRPPLLKL